MRDGEQIVFTGHGASTRVFVAPEAGKYAPIAQLTFEPFGDHAKELVACGVAESIVDFLESVEVDQQHPRMAAGACLGGERRLQAFEKGPPVCEPGEVIGSRVLV